MLGSSRSPSARAARLPQRPRTLALDVIPRNEESRAVAPSDAPHRAARGPLALPLAVLAGSYG